MQLTRREDGRYEANGELIGSGDTIQAKNGNMYRLTLVNNQWNVEFVPQGVNVELGTGSNSITLMREQDGRYWLGRMAIEDGHIHETEDGNRYRLRLRNGQWIGEYLPHSDPS